ncbi:hypothetical protein AWB91_03050 [Mycobacterium paraense]|uniref:Phosphatidylserine decarboxylase n=1 Tax=Mycobacterium paraense TaxID=767916 RepID=A0ABX3VG74_9MYCO|nr:phosphatidylserine decarboxylase [Mycobacterium paraense]ORW27295.1 hypothetical protein AWB91_03050 [Mycobacterium paraense]ORW43868.1 hypothetical protein AWB88_06335 [Mycobacterium paraense]
MSDPDAVIRELRELLTKESGLADLIERSLAKARESAEAELKPELFEALEWPLDIDEYEAYLKRFVRWVPRQSDAAAWQEQGQAKELNDRTAHFFFMVDQEIDGERPQDSAAFRADSNIPATTIKNTHKFGNINQHIEGSAYRESFGSGTFVHYMLPPSAYHRYHLPVPGHVKESFLISGKVFMRIGLQDHEFQSSDSATTGYEFTQNRGVVTLDTAASDGGDVGVVAVIPVGMAHVSSVMLTAVEGRHMAKGEEFGYFQFGGSDIIVLFQEGVDPQIDTSDDFRFVGTPMARCSRR